MTTQNWTLKETDGREHWLAKSYVPAELRPKLQTTDLLLIPQDGFREYAGPLFPVGTEEFLRSLQDGASGLTIDITVADADYKELALHADWLILATVFVGGSVVVPTAVNLISEYLKRKLWPEDSKRGVKVKLLLEQRTNATSQCVEVSFEGPAADFETSMGAVLSELRGRGFSNTTAPDDVQNTPREEGAAVEVLDTADAKPRELPAGSEGLVTKQNRGDM